jgi:AAA domain, putative AbiEii toxin, Type IV TA system
VPTLQSPRLLSFTLDGSDVLGGPVSIDLRDRVAVLVGRNGAGKSAILEGFESIKSWAFDRFRSQIFDTDIESIPNILEIEVLTPHNRRLQYRYELVSLSASLGDPQELEDDSSIDSIENVEESRLSWNDCCQYLDQAQEVLWQTDVGLTTFPKSSGEQAVSILGRTGLLRQQGRLGSGNYQLSMPEELEWIYSVLSRVRLLGKTPIRLNPYRNKFFLQVSNDRPRPSPSLYRRLYILVRKIFSLDKDTLHELKTVCQRIGIGSQIIVQKFFPGNSAQSNSETEAKEHLVSVLLDGVNIGLLSDGTLRILDLLLELITSRPGTTTMIEEPETQIHPGLLEKLLNEIEAYTADENLILSTHSPQVVSWTQPDKINLVYRQNDRTYIRKLQEPEIQSVVNYLCEEGDLGNWLYSGILDD